MNQDKLYCEIADKETRLFNVLVLMRYKRDNCPGTFDMSLVDEFFGLCKDIFVLSELLKNQSEQMDCNND